MLQNAKCRKKTLQNTILLYTMSSSSLVGTKHSVVELMVNWCKCQHQISLHPNLTQLVADQTETRKQDCIHWRTVLLAVYNWVTGSPSAVLTCGLLLKQWTSCGWLLLLMPLTIPTQVLTGIKPGSPRWEFTTLTNLGHSW